MIHAFVVAEENIKNAVARAHLVQIQVNPSLH
jgi:hypothetical protein